MKKLAGAAVLLAASSFFSLVLNFATQAYLAWRFGAGTDMDAYVAAMTLPAVFAIVLAPSLGLVVVPIFVDALKTRSVDQTWRMASTIINATAIALAALAAVVIASADPVMRAVVPGLDPATTSVAASLLRVLIIGTFFSAIAAVLTAFYQSDETFRPTAIAPVLGAAVLLGSAFVLAPWLGIHGIAVATVIGNLAQVIWLSPVLRKRYRPVLDLTDDGVRAAGKLLLPLVLGGLAYRTTIVADRLVASWLPKGTLSHLDYANRIASVINSVFASGIAAALYPRMSSQAAAGDLRNLELTFERGQRVLMLFLFPALAVGWTLRVQILELLLERGRFTRVDTLAVAEFLTWFMLGVVGGALGLLQARVYYVLKDTRTPALIGIGETLAYFVYLPLLARAFGATGVAMANAVYLLSALVVNGAVVLRKLRAERVRIVLLAGAKLALFAGLAGTAAWGVSHVVTNPVPLLVIGSTAGAAVYAAALFASRAEELSEVRALLGGLGASRGK